MRGFLTWVSGAAFAFFVTASAFLLLANLGTGPSETELPSRPADGGSGPPLSLLVRKTGLESLQPASGQSLAFDLRNGGDRELTDISLAVRVFPEDTAITETRDYTATVEKLAAGETATANFDVVDLSPPPGLDTRRNPEPPRWIVEARATTPGGVSTVRTVILPRPST